MINYEQICTYTYLLMMLFDIITGFKTDFNTHEKYIFISIKRNY